MSEKVYGIGSTHQYAFYLDWNFKLIFHIWNKDGFYVLTLNWIKMSKCDKVHQS
jgi:hypothetical protein